MQIILEVNKLSDVLIASILSNQWHRNSIIIPNLKKSINLLVSMDKYVAWWHPLFVETRRLVVDYPSISNIKN